jgi:nitrous oxide reductase accessory protein NosL
LNPEHIKGLEIMKIRIIFISIYVFSLILFSGGSTPAQEVSCIYCGMDKAKFGYSWVVIVHADDTRAELCSIHCAAIHLALHTHQTIDAITVGDYFTARQIDADKAHWVIGGDKLGVMTSRAKWAFETWEAAGKFIKEHGGQPAVFKDVIKAAFEDMYQDTVMIQKKRKLMKMLQPTPRN